MKNYFVTGLIVLIILGMINIMFLSFDQAPDIYIWTWFGYKFGINFSSYTELRLTTLALAIMLLMYLSIRSEQKIKNS